MADNYNQMNMNPWLQMLVNNLQNQMQMNQLQPQQQPQNTLTVPQNTTNPSVIFGRVVNSEEDIRPQDVPNDSSIAYFPSSDRKTIFAKYWDDKCNIRTDTYVKIEDENQSSPASDLQAMSDRMQALEQKLDQLIEANSNRNNNRQNGGKNWKGDNNNG